MSTGAFCPRNYSNDIISNLPDSIQSHILSFLPTVDAVATSLLSTKWKNIWTTLSTLTFDDRLAPFDYQELPGEISKNVKFAKFVNGVLHFLGGNSLLTFSLTCASNVVPYDISSWVSVSITKGVRELHLSILDFSPVELPECLFYCVTLEVINLEGQIMIKVPNVVYLPNLRSLKLFHVEYEDDGYARKLLSGCTSLDYLDINIGMEESVDLDPYIITSSSLRFLRYDANDENVEFMTILEEGVGIKSSDSARCCLCCKTLEELHLSAGIIKDTFCLPNLRVLKLCYVEFDSDVLASNLLSSIPSLESLVIIETIAILKLKISSSTLRYLTIKESDELVLVLDAPALQRLNLRSFVLEGIHIKDLSSLIDASIHLGFRQNVHDKRYNNIMDILFHGLCNVKILSLSGRCMRATFPEQHQFPKFPKLAVLRVGVGCFDCPLLQQFIKNCNTLEDLILISEKAYYGVTDSGRIIPWKDPEIVPECLLSSFQRLSFYGFEGFENELAMVEYLLKNSRMMQRMTIELFPTLDKDNKIDLLQKLLKFRRGSEGCEMDVRSDGSLSDLRHRWLTFFH